MANWQKSATELARLIRKRDVSAREVTQELIARIQTLEPALGALATPCFEQAVQQARSWDAAPRAGALLGGVPFTLPADLEVAGLPQLSDDGVRIAGHSAALVQRLFDQGGILLGLTNVSPARLWNETQHPQHGRCGHPYDPHRTPGGSSGGEAALIAAGGSPLGLGDELGGGLSIPAFYCGLYGHKPGRGRLAPLPPVPGPLGPRPRLPGVIARTSADLRLMLRALGIEPAAEAIDWQGRKVFCLSRPKLRLATAVQPEIARGVEAAARQLADAGAEVLSVPDRLFEDIVDLWLATLDLPDAAWKLVPEAIQLLRGRARHSAGELLVAGLARSRRPGPSRRHQLLQALERLLATLQRYLGSEALLMLPPQPTFAPRHDELMARPFDFGYALLGELWPGPVTAIPTAIGSDGLPLGIQVLAGIDQERLGLAAAEKLETGWSGWRKSLFR